MKMYALAVLAMISLYFSCSSPVQLLQTKETTPMREEMGAYVFENDTVKITYSFWAKHGVLSYNIFNKLNVPLYIDWKKSSYIKNGQKLDYWINIETTSNVSKGHNTFSYGTIYGTSYNNSTTIKPEQIVFIAPSSSITKEQFLLIPEDKIDFANNGIQEQVSNNVKTIKIKSVAFSETNSPLVFRNFLTISTSDKFEKEAYIDNGFYISKISQMDMKDFWGDAYAKTEYWRNRNNRKPPFQSPRNFYLSKK